MGTCGYIYYLFMRMWGIIMYTVYKTVNDSYAGDVATFNSEPQAYNYCCRNGWEIQGDDGVWYDLHIERED